MQKSLLENALEQAPEAGFGIIYKVTLSSGKAYIGKTTRKLKYRMSSHCGRYSACSYFSRALRKYGLGGAFIEILGIHKKSVLAKREIEKIAEHRTQVPNGYNLSSGGEGGTIHPRTGRLISAKLRGLIRSLTTRKRNSAALLGRALSAQSKKTYFKQLASKEHEGRLNWTLNPFRTTKEDYDRTAGTKQCRRCGQWLPNNDVFFYSRGRSLRSECKTCWQKLCSNTRSGAREARSAKQRQYYHKHKLNQLLYAAEKRRIQGAVMCDMEKRE